MIATGLVAMAALAGPATATATATAGERWSEAKAAAWQAERGWLVGCNYAPANAINQLEMWQADTFDLATIDRELALAEGLGFNSVRVFLHHLLWDQDREGFLKRMGQFLDVAAKHKIGVMFVPLDSVWDPDPKPGRQRDPVPHRHNSGWAQSPGRAIIGDPRRHDELKPYIQGVIRHFKDDPRIHAWDLINEPDNMNRNSYGKLEPPNKPEMARILVAKVFAWAREVDPSQPLTCGVWQYDWAPDKINEINKLQLDLSDVISFHCYDPPDNMIARINSLKRFNRPMLCTEYMARPGGSLFDPVLGLLKSQKVAAYNWGFVAGKTQTNYPWDSWQKAYTAEPPLWFHEIFRADGTPYLPREVEYIRKQTGVAVPAAAGAPGR
jgi:hypothetical protein